jgi:hypothetical protein
MVVREHFDETEERNGDYWGRLMIFLMCIWLALSFYELWSSYDFLNSISVATATNERLSEQKSGTCTGPYCDVNADGLPDLIYSAGSAGTYVSINTGTGFATPTIATSSVIQYDLPSASETHLIPVS